MLAYLTTLRNTLRTVSWIKAARKDFEAFPARAIDRALDALTVLADGGTPDVAKPLAELGADVMGTGDQRARRRLSGRLCAATG